MPPNIKKIINEISILVKLFFNTYYYIEINLSINLVSNVIAIKIFTLWKDS